MRLKAWEIATALSQKILPNAKLSRSQIVEIALHRWANEMKDKDPSFIIEDMAEANFRKQPDLPVVGTAVTYEEVKARNKAIVHHRLYADNKLTLQQLGTMYNITRERVRQIQDRHQVSTETLKQTNKEKHAS
jgi:DNA-directed RNA polymerase sigma subunit (sigma70/sigma32)